MDMKELMLGVFLCTGMVSILALIIGDVMQKIARIKNIQSESDLMNILNRAIEREFNYKVNFEFKIKGITVVGDIEKEVNDLVHSTMKSLGKNILNDLTYYYSLSTITEMVFKAHMLLLTDYMDKSKSKSKKKNYEEYRITK
jgi:hypothetical protein